MVKQVKKIAAIGLSVIMATTATLSLSFSASAEDAYQPVYDFSGFTSTSTVTGVTKEVNNNWNVVGNNWSDKANVSITAGDGCISLYSKCTSDYINWGYGEDGWQSNHVCVAFKFAINNDLLNGEGVAFDYTLSSALRMYYRILANGKYFYTEAYGGGVPQTAATSVSKQKVLKYSSFVQTDGTAMTAADISSITSFQICCKAPNNAATLSISKISAVNPPRHDYEKIADYSNMTTASAAPSVPVTVNYGWKSNGNQWGSLATGSVSAGDGCLKLKGGLTTDGINWGYAYDGWVTEAKPSIAFKMPITGEQMDGEGIAVDYTLSANVKLFYRIYSNGKFFFNGATGDATGNSIGQTAAASTTQRKLLKYTGFVDADNVVMTASDVSNIQYFQICYMASSTQVTMSVLDLCVYNPAEKVCHAVLDYTDYNSTSTVTGITNKTTYGWNGGDVDDWNQYANRSVTAADGSIQFKTSLTALGSDYQFGLQGSQTVKPAIAFSLPISAEQLKGDGVAIDYTSVTANRVFYRVASGDTLFFVDGTGSTNNSGIPTILAGATGQKLIKYLSFKRADGTAITEDEVANISSFQICFYPTETPTTFSVSRVYVYNPVNRTHTYTAQSKSAAGGTVAGGGAFNYNDTVTLTATASENFVFAGWYRGNSTTAVSTDATYSFTATPELCDKTYTAKFTSTIQGDANDDGKVDIKDFVRLKKYLVGMENIEINLNTADVNRADSVDPADLVLFRQYLLGFRTIV